MGTALQMPVATSNAREVGPKLFRKQVLRVGRIPYRGRVLEFSRDYLAKIARHFREGAYDQVPFVLADGENRHNEDPDRFRGEVKAVELSGDGLDVIVELTDDGADLVRKNPRLGVSARIVEVAGDGGPRHVPALRHVCGTMDPHVSGLRPWEAISRDSVLSASHDGDQTVIDLSNATYMDSTKTLTDDQLKELQDLKPEERATKVHELLGESTSGEDKDRKDDGEKPGLFQRLFGRKPEKDEETVEAALQGLIAGAKGEDGEDDKDEAARKLETANLSKEAREAIDLANQTAADAKREASEARRQLRESEFERTKAALVADGVPPADVDLCKPLLMGEVGTIDLSNGEKADTVELAKELLEARKGTIDMTETGSGVDKGRADEAKDLASDEKWGASV